MIKIVFSLLLFAFSTNEPQVKSISVDGERRHAVVYANAQPGATTGAPILFVFHGHGGTAESSARNFKFHTLWKDALVVYMQGLTGVAGINDPEGKRTGWQKNPGELNDRDVKFFDAALAQLQKDFKVDLNRVYVMGHSNGARFVNVLWVMRGEKITALCSSSAQGGRLLQTVTPKPVFMIAGEQDNVAPYQTQMMTIDYARKQLFKTDATKAKTEGYARTEQGSDGTEMVTYLHPGGHQFPAEAAPLVVNFFKRQMKKASK